VAASRTTGTSGHDAAIRDRAAARTVSVTASTKELSEYARFLRNAAPQAFNDFCTAFLNYTGQKTNDLVKTAGTENVLLVQGHAQQCLAILNVLEEVKKNG
jgi:hypothetical protein